MGAFYGDEKEWEAFDQFAFEAALTRTDVVIQPRQSNTWGALSLDHVYEFMGGLNLAVKQVTGKEPDAYLSDYRNHNRMRMQEVKEGHRCRESHDAVQSYLYQGADERGGECGQRLCRIGAEHLWLGSDEAGRHRRGMWTEIYEVYAKDKLNLGCASTLKIATPAALGGDLSRDA